MSFCEAVGRMSNNLYDFMAMNVHFNRVEGAIDLYYVIAIDVVNFQN